MDQTGAKILLAQKAFSMYSLYPLIGSYLAGTCASGLYEAKLGKEEMGNREVHVYSPAYKPEEIKELLPICDHMVFNSIHQWERYKEEIFEWNKKNPKQRVSCGLRVNPGYSGSETEIYNPCAPFSRLGIPAEQLKDFDFSGIEGIHFHCTKHPEIEFDEGFDEDEEYYGKRIKECVVPGIAKKANDDCGDDVLIPAVVKVEMEN